MKRLILFLICLIFVSSSVGFTTEKKEAVSISLNGESVQFPDMQPYVNEDDRTMIPVRFISELLDAKVEWHAEGGFAKITKGAFEIGIPVGSRTIIKNGKYYTMDTETSLEDDRVMVPLRFVSEHLGAEVTYSEEANCVNILTGAETFQTVDRVTEGQLELVRAKDPAQWDEAMGEFQVMIAKPEVASYCELKSESRLLISLRAGEREVGDQHDLTLVQYDFTNDGKQAVKIAISKIIGEDLMCGLMEVVGEWDETYSEQPTDLVQELADYHVTYTTIGPGYPCFHFDLK